MTITVPPEQEETAKRLSRVFDEDSGGYEAEFKPSYSTPILTSFAEQIPMLLENPLVLHTMVSSKYAERFPELVAPTLEEITVFLSSAIITITEGV